MSYSKILTTYFQASNTTSGTGYLNMPQMQFPICNDSLFMQGDLCKAKALVVMPNQHPCVEIFMHESDHQCACGFRWKNTREPAPMPLGDEPEDENKIDLAPKRKMELD